MSPRLGSLVVSVPSPAKRGRDREGAMRKPTDNGFSVLRLTNPEVYAGFEGVLETIRLRVDE